MIHPLCPRGGIARQPLLIIIGAAACGMAVAVWLWPRPGRPTTADWNVVIVTFDTTRADRLGCYGHRRARTPTLDNLARHGVHYLHCYTPAPITLPAHASLMTGLVPLRHGIHDNGPDALAPQVETLAEILGRHGYQTSAFVGAFVLDRQFGLAQGFDHYDDDLSRGEPASQFHYAERNAELVTDAALAWLARPSEKPILLWVHYFDPHAPYAAPNYDPTFTSQTAYEAEISFADEQLRRIVERCDELAGRPTLLIVTADHGEGLGDHHEATHGLFTYNSTMHVPLLVRLPDRRHAGSRIETAVSLVDVMPSVLTWLGLRVPSDLDGRPLPLSNLPPAQERGEPRGIYFENYFVSNTFGWSPLSGGIWQNLKYIRAPEPELYDLASDPAEQRQLYDATDERSQKAAEKFEALVGQLLARGCFAPQAVAMSDTDVIKLESLGYVGGQRPTSSSPLEADPAAADPKAMVAVHDQIDEAAELLQQDLPVEASAILLRIAKHDDPGNPRVLRYLSMLMVEEVELRPQIADCLLELRRQQVRELDAYALHALGAALVESRRYREAVDVLEELVRRVPLCAVAFCHLGDAQLALEQPAAAGGSYRRAIALVGSLDEPPDWLAHARQQLTRCETPLSPQ